MAAQKASAVPWGCWYAFACWLQIAAVVQNLVGTQLVVKRFIAVHRKPSSLPSVRFTIHTHGGSVRSHVQPGGCILLSFIKTNTKSDLICIGRSTKSVSLRLISDNTGVYLLTYMQNRSFTNQHFSTKSQYLRKMASILISTNLLAFYWCNS